MRVRTATYVAWINMRQRCSPNHHQAADYFDRGIRVDPRWDSFAAFLADMGERPDGLTLDRKNNDLGYSPENCRWATRNTQSRNRRHAALTALGAVLVRQVQARVRNKARVAVAFGISRGLVRDVVSGRSWPAAIADLQWSL